MSRVSGRKAERRLTVHRTEPPMLVLAVIVRGGTPQVPVLPPDARAVVKPLAVVQEGQVAGTAV